MTLTLRRYHLDNILTLNNFYGRVLDVGGKKHNKRGRFRPQMDLIDSWEYVNIDPKDEPDFLCSADAIPVPDDVYDFLILTDVMEHLEDPEMVLKECNRVLKSSGILVATMPFLYPLHADPCDYQRWTPSRLRIELNRTGFKVLSIESMGGLFAVIYDLLYVSLGSASKNSRAIKNRIIRRFILPLVLKVCLKLDKKYNYKASKITTGWYIKAFKNA